MSLTKCLMLFLVTAITYCGSAAAQESDEIPPTPSTLGNRGNGVPAVKKNTAPPTNRTVQRGQRNRGRTGGKLPGQSGLAGKHKDVKVKFASIKDRPVLVMDSIGGFRVAPPEGFQETPLLEIYADGRIVTGRKSPSTEEVVGEMDLVELKTLLSFIADDCRFFDLSTDSIKKDMTSNSRIVVMDAATTQITVNLDEHSNSVEIYALPQATDKRQKIDSVASMAAIASRCRRIIAMTRLGSHEEASVALGVVNRALRDQSPSSPKFTLENLQFAERFTDGRRTASFVQKDEGKNMIYATWQLDAEGTASANVNLIKRK